MIPVQTLGALAGIHERLVQLVEALPTRDVNRRFHPRLPAVGWLLGRAVYLETHLLRGHLFDDHDLSERVRHFFAHDVVPDDALFAQLPPQDHLLNWALEIFDHHMTLLANPRFLPEHPLLEGGWLPAWLVQRHALIYETLLAVTQARTLNREHDNHAVTQPLRAHRPAADSQRIDQGHYRIGARKGVITDCEQPVQVVELHAFRIQKRPVSNAEFLAFIEEGGYENTDWWDAAGQDWLARHERTAPWHWRRDAQGLCYGEGIKGPADLAPDEPVTGINIHEARAFAAWASTQIEELEGAVLQHEYQWETAARLGLLEDTGRAREWCANPFEAYDAYQAPEDPELATLGLDAGWNVQRGASLHSQPAVRRTSFRIGVPADTETGFAGLRLLLPPGPAFWEY